jgi:hypothetical protein
MLKQKYETLSIKLTQLLFNILNSVLELFDE